MRCIKKMVTAEAFRYDGSLKGADGEYYIPGWAAEAFEKRDIVLWFAGNRGAADRAFSAGHAGKAVMGTGRLLHRP